jgi:hypothetical protein
LATEVFVNDTRLQCGDCLSVRYAPFGDCLAHGWPECCGHTMRLEALPRGLRIEDAVKQLLANVPATPSMVALAVAA